MNDKYYSVAQIANKFGCSEKTIRRVIKTLDIGVQLKAGNTNLYAENDVEKIQQQLAKNQMLQGANSETGKRAVKDVLSANFETSHSLSAFDFEMISKIVAVTVKTTIEQLMPAIPGLNHPQPNQLQIEAPKLDSRAHVTRIVRDYAQAAKMPYQDVYSMLYTEFGYRTHSNPSKCAINRKMKIIDYIEVSGQMPALEALAEEFLIPPKKYEKDWLAE